MPFIFAWIIAALIQPAVKFIHEKTKLSVKFATVTIVILLFLLLAFALYLIISRIVYEVTALSQTIMINTDIITKYINDFFRWLENILEDIPVFSEYNILESLKLRLNNIIGTFLSSVGTFLASNLPSFLTSIIKLLPAILLFVLILIVSTFYISLDYKVINTFIMIQIPKKVHTILIDIKNRFFEAIFKYLKAYSIIIFITYCELTAGFLVIGINYAFLLAGIVAFVDVLPVLGSGTVLIPWGIVNIVQKNYFEGFALLILYAVITIIRQVIEPKIVGKSIGLYPVVTLITLYVGFNLFGFLGMFFLPVILMIVKSLNDEGKIKLWKILDKSHIQNSKAVKTKKQAPKSKYENRTSANKKS